MISFVTAMAAAAAAQATPAAPVTDPYAGMQMEHSGMDMGKMDHSKMDHRMMGKNGGDCCKQTADGKMECDMSGMKSGTDSAHQGHSGR